jgi:UDPglucose 6-dehydrogenase
LSDLVGDVAGRTIAILGLTYKPGTSTLRRSSAVELARALHACGATLRAFDPEVSSLPSNIDVPIFLARSVGEAVRGAHAAVIATDWPQFRTEKWDQLVRTMASPVILDPSGSVADQLWSNDTVTYAAVGRGSRKRNQVEMGRGGR